MIVGSVSAAGGCDPQRLVDQLRAGGQQLLDLAEVVLAEREQQLDGERPAQEPTNSSTSRCCASRLRLVEQRHDLLELVEDDQRPVASHAA